MKKLNITKEAYDKSKYFTRKYGKLEYVSESGKIYKTDKGKILKFNENAFGGYTPDELEDELQKYEKEQDGIDASKKSKPQKSVDVVKPEIKEGTILYSVWGYSMTLVDFYEVKRRIGRSTLEIVRLKKTETGGGMMGETTPIEGEYSGEPFKVRFNKYGNLKADGSKYLEIWDGKPKYYNRMD